MSINRQKHLYEHKRGIFTQDEYGQSKPSYSVLGYIEVALYQKEQKITENNPIYTEVTHIGITTTKDIKKQDLIGEYEVVYVNNIGRTTTLLLKEV